MYNRTPPLLLSLDLIFSLPLFLGSRFDAGNFTGLNLTVLSFVSSISFFIKSFIAGSFQNTSRFLFNNSSKWHSYSDVHLHFKFPSITTSSNLCTSGSDMGYETSRYQISSKLHFSLSKHWCILLFNSKVLISLCDKFRTSHIYLALLQHN